MKRKCNRGWKVVSRTLKPEFLVSIDARGELRVRTEYEVTSTAGAGTQDRRVESGPDLQNILKELHLGPNQLNILALLEGGVKLVETLVKRYEVHLYRKSGAWERDNERHKKADRRWREREKKQMKEERIKQKKARLVEKAKKAVDREIKKEAKRLAAKKKKAERVLKKAQLLAAKALLAIKAKEAKKAEAEQKKLQDRLFNPTFGRSLDLNF